MRRQQIEWLLRNGAAEVLVLPSQAIAPQRVLIHWADDSARRPTLAVAASLLRHVAAEAVYVGILPEGAGDSQRPLGVRTLLDARSEAQAVHGLEMRTELRFGAAAEELQRQLSESPDQMLILGISDLAQLRERFAALFAVTAAVLDDDRVSAGARRRRARGVTHDANPGHVVTKRRWQCLAHAGIADRAADRRR